MKKFTK